MTRVLLILFFSASLSSLQAQRSAVAGGVNPHIPVGVCLTEEQRTSIKAMLADNIAMLKSEGKIPAVPENAKISTLALSFPLAFNITTDDYGFHAISNFVDHDEAYPGHVLDYNCGARTYDTETYNHSGIDFYLWPFDWNKVHDGDVKVIAAAPGIIIAKTDGNFDESCAFNSSSWNAIFVQHPDGSIIWYGHMKKYSLTSKNIGDAVETGEYLGTVGSSGNSTGPHLHLEVYDPDGNLIDPNTGPCNEWNIENWWADPRPYYDPAVNKIQTHSSPPTFYLCPNDDSLNESDEFYSGDLAYFATYFKDLRDIDSCHFEIREPDGYVFDAWDFNQPYPYFSSSYWYWSEYLPLDALEGTWQFSCVMHGFTYVHNFTVHNAVAVQNYEEGFSQVAVSSSGDVIHITLHSPSSMEADYAVTDISGQKITTAHNNLQPGNNSFSIQNSDLAAGVYILTVNSPSSACRAAVKFIVL